MTYKLIASSDVAPMSTSGINHWQSSGDDPFFGIHFGTFRKRFIVIYLNSQSHLLDPRIYIDHGRGYSESHAQSFETGGSFIFTADIGSVGLIRSLRIDPATCPCQFVLTVEGYESSVSANEAIAARLSTDMAGAKLCDLGRLPRFGIPRLHLPFRRQRNDVETFVQTHYALASALAHPERPFGDHIWLSIVVPVYNAPPRYLDDLVRSFRNQKVMGTELILSDDASNLEETLRWLTLLPRQNDIRIVFNPQNSGISQATNAGLTEARGEWITFLDHDDVIAPDALNMIARTLREHPETMFLYTDEVVVDDKLRPKGVMLKPAADPVLLSGVNYINHFSLYRRERLQQIGFLRTGFDGSQDYDLLLRYLHGLADETILHLPYPAYWWRRTGQSYSRKFIDRATQAARKALQDRYSTSGKTVTVCPALTETLHKIDFAANDWPMISIIIPSRNNFDLIRRILRDIFEHTDYPAFEVLVVDNGSTSPEVLSLYADYAARYTNFRAEIKVEKFNFARAINKGMALARGEHFLLLNNDTEVINGNWLKELVSCLSYDKVGIVGAKLLYPNGKIQHAGVIVGFGGLAGHCYLNKPSDFGGPMNRLHVRNTMTCVTGAVMLISRSCAQRVGKWDEANFSVAYNDVDYCMRAYKAGFRTVWTPFACLYHHESVSRGSDLVGERKKRFDREKENLRKLHGTVDFQDPAMNPGYERNHSTPNLQMPLIAARARRWWPGVDCD